MTFIDVLDTSIKIGLGAFISGVLTLKLSKQNHENELKKIAVVRKLESLEKAAEKAEMLFYRWRKLTSALGGIYRGRKPPESNFSSTQWERIRARDRDWLAAQESLYQAISHLRLLGAEDAADSLLSISRAMSRFRDPMILQREAPLYEDLKRTRAEVRVLIQSFHLEMAALYAMPRA